MARNDTPLIKTTNGSLKLLQAKIGNIPSEQMSALEYQLNIVLVQIYIIVALIKRRLLYTR